MILRTAVCITFLGFGSSIAIAQATNEGRVGRRTLLPRPGALRNTPDVIPGQSPASTNAASPTTPARVGLFPLLRRRQDPPASNPNSPNEAKSNAADLRQSPPTSDNQPNNFRDLRSPSRNGLTNRNAVNDPNAAGSRVSISSSSAVQPASALRPGGTNPSPQSAAYVAPPIPNEPTVGEKYFYEAVNSFQQERYEQSLIAANVGSVRYPSDIALKELQGLIHFARGDFDKAAQSVRLALLAGGGWDWQSIVEIYGAANIAKYTKQLRELETAVSENVSSAPLRFLLAYHYQVAGHEPQAERQLRQVVQLDPRDELARAILGMPPLPATTTDDESDDVESLPAPPVEVIPTPKADP